MAEIKTSPKKLKLQHGLLCFDFTNTLIWRLREEPIEGFGDFSIFIKWGRYIGLLTEETAATLLTEGERNPEEAARVLEQAIELREALYGIIVAKVEGNQPEEGNLVALNSEISNMFKRMLLTEIGDQFEWGWRIAETDLDQMLWPILLSATELLTSPEMERIGICEGDGCGWLFYDRSRNHSRKWCDMGDCGNRAKARRYYKRKRNNPK